MPETSQSFLRTCPAGRPTAGDLEEKPLGELERKTSCSGKEKMLEENGPCPPFLLWLLRPGELCSRHRGVFLRGAGRTADTGSGEWRNKRNQEPLASGCFYSLK